MSLHFDSVVESKWFWQMQHRVGKRRPYNILIFVNHYKSKFIKPQFNDDCVINYLLWGHLIVFFQNGQSSLDKTHARSTITWICPSNLINIYYKSNLYTNNKYVLNCFSSSLLTLTTLVFLGGSAWISVGSNNFSPHPSPTRVMVNVNLSISSGAGPSCVTYPAEKNVGN